MLTNLAKLKSCTKIETNFSINLSARSSTRTSKKFYICAGNKSLSTSGKMLQNCSRIFSTERLISDTVWYFQIICSILSTHCSSVHTIRINYLVLFSWFYFIVLYKFTVECTGFSFIR